MRSHVALASLVVLICATVHSQTSAADSFTVTARWETESDIDVLIIDPKGLGHFPLKECSRGPGSETCVVRSPGEGDHTIRLKCFTPRGAGPNYVTVEVRRGGRIVGTTRVVLQEWNETRFLSVDKLGRRPRVWPLLAGVLLGVSVVALILGRGAHRARIFVRGATAGNRTNPEAKVVRLSRPACSHESSV